MGGEELGIIWEEVWRSWGGAGEVLVRRWGGALSRKFTENLDFQEPHTKLLFKFWKLKEP